MKLFRKIGCLLMIFVLTTSFAFASSKTITREYTFETMEKNFNYTQNAQITIEGKKWKKFDIKYELVTEFENIVEKEITGLTEKEVEKEMKINKITYKLKDVKYKTHLVNTSSTYSNYDERPEIPQTKVVAVDSNRKELLVTANLKDVKRTITSSYSKPFTVPAQFYGKSDVIFYMLDKKKVPNNPEKPVFNGYENIILEHLNLDPKLYKITDANWTSQYYTNANGQTVRDASFNGIRKSNDFQAEYSGEYYDVKAKYENGKEGEKTYIVKAIISYEKIGMPLWQKVLIAGVGILVLIGLATLILMFLRKKREQKE